MGGATREQTRTGLFAGFQSTLPVGGATSSIRAESSRRGYFNPRSPWGERQPAAILYLGSPKFQSTLPVGGATPGNLGSFFGDPFQSTLPVGGATYQMQGTNNGTVISIHAPRGGSDDASVQRPEYLGDFNPRSPWGERHSRRLGWAWSSSFQSTLPVGGATRLTRKELAQHAAFQSTLPVGGATSLLPLKRMWLDISIHAPRGGSDCC